MHEITLKGPKPKKVKLGRRPPKLRRRALSLSSYIAPRYQSPAACDWSQKASASLARMYLNDALGDCVIAGEAHLVGVRTANDGGEVQFQDDEIKALYEEACGAGDQGCVIADVLDHLARVGWPGGHKLAGWVLVDNARPEVVKAAVYELGGVTLGINLPAQWADGVGPGFIWDATDSTSVGGHEVVCVGYTDKGVITSTWGMLGTITWRALADRRIVEEAYAAVSRDWTGDDDLSPTGFHLQELLDDLAQLGGEGPEPEPQAPTITQFLDSVLDGLISTLGWVPVLGDSLRAVKLWIDGFFAFNPRAAATKMVAGDSIVKTLIDQVLTSLAQAAINYPLLRQGVMLLQAVVDAWLDAHGYCVKARANSPSSAA